MIYLDHGATSMGKPPSVEREMLRALRTCGNPGRGGHRAAMLAAEIVYGCREEASRIFDCSPEQVVFTSNCTHGLNLAIHTLVKEGSRVVISGFEHNAVTRPLYGIGAKVSVAGRRLFDREELLEQFDEALRRGADAAVFTHVSNVFGYILPVEELAQLCRRHGVPFAVDAAQAAGSLPVSLSGLGADFIAMPGHKGLLGPQGTGLLLCGALPEPLLRGGTGSDSRSFDMPAWLPDGAEAGTLNVPGIAGLLAGMREVKRMGIPNIARREHAAAKQCAEGLRQLGFRVFSGEAQSGTVSFVPNTDCEKVAEVLARRGVAVRAGLHCAPLAHESAGTLETGTVRVSFGHDASARQVQQLLQELKLAEVM